MDRFHTAEPWLAAAKPSSIVGWPIVAAGGRLIGEVALGHRPPDCSDERWAEHYREVEANSKLIAAAPAMLSALEGLTAIIRAAGLSNLSRGVELGQVSWSVKASDRMEEAQRAIDLATQLEPI